MDINRCFEMFDLDHTASPDDVKQAYRDSVNVWHPDRFANNQRLKQKAEEKLKEINVAYEVLKTYQSSKQKLRPEQENVPKEKSASGENINPNGKTENKAAYRHDQETQDAGESSNAKDKTAALAKNGAGLISGLWSYLFSLFQRVETDSMTRKEQELFNQGRGKTDAGGRGRGRGIKRGKGRGRGDGMGGRGSRKR